MFGNLNFSEIIVLVLLGLFIFGPDRLPKYVAEAVRFLRGVRRMAKNASAELSRELGTEVSLEDLNPKTFVRKHLLTDEEQDALRRPFEDLARDLQGVGSDVQNSVTAKEKPEPRTPGQHRAQDPDAT